MFIELTEILVCPSCRRRGTSASAQGLVAVVEELDDRRVRSGSLGCPACEARHLIENGAVLFGGRVPLEGRALLEGRGPYEGEEASASGGALESGASFSTAGPDLPMRVAALLGADDAAGYLVLGRGLETAVDELSRLAPAAELIVLGGSTKAYPRVGDRGGHGRQAGGVSWLVGLEAHVLPFRDRSVAGIALTNASPTGLAEAARVVAQGGRVAVFGPREVVGSEDGPPAGLEGLKVLAADEHALIASRP